MGRYVLPGNVHKIILKPIQFCLRTPTRAMCSSRDVEHQVPQRQVTSDDLHLMEHAMQALMRIAFFVLASSFAERNHPWRKRLLRPQALRPRTMDLLSAIRVGLM
jgi:hypothetical protein